MARRARSRGRGTAAAFGLVLLLAGLVGAAVLYVLASQRPDKAVEGFARAGVGCTTTLDFSETGTFFVYQETTTGDVAVDGGCQPSAAPDQPFGFGFTDPDGVVAREDRSISYQSGPYTGTSIARISIEEVGRYDIEVRGPDPATVAAIGRDPDEGVSEMRQGALAVGVAGVVLGSLLLLLAGWRSKRAATPSIPDGPGWGQRADDVPAWPPAPPRVPQVPVNPQQPDLPAYVAPPPPPLPARSPSSGTTGQRSPWAPPTVGAPVPPPPTPPTSDD